VDEPAAISDKRLDSPPILIPSANAQLTFRNNYNLEEIFDGGVLEISIGGGAFTDILAAGGSFVTGGYIATVSTCCGNPLGDRFSWTGNSNGFVTTTVNLPPAAMGQVIGLRWRMGSDSSNAGDGWRIDNIHIDCEGPTPTPIISGRVHYGTNVSKNVAGVSINVTGSQSSSTLTDSSGNYSISLPAGGNYTLTPSKTGDVNGISAFDAAQVAQHVAGIITLNGNQQIAGDASNNGTLSAFDAALIAQTVAGIPNAGIAGTWKFVPSNRSYNPLSADQINQDFDGILVGEVSGNWTPPAAPSGVSTDLASKGLSSTTAPGESPAANVTVALPFKVDPAGSTSTIPVLVGDTTGLNVIGYDFTMTFDSAVLSPQNPVFETAGTLSAGWSITPNTSTPGQVRIVAFNPTPPLSGSGTLIKLKFTVVGSNGNSTPLTWTNFVFNEGDPTAALINGTFTVGSPSAASASISGQILTSNGLPLGGVLMTLSGPSLRRAITDASGNYSFGNVETGAFYDVSPTLANYTFSPANRSFSLLANMTDAVFTAIPDAVPTANPLDTAEYFVRQHYLDFLNREPDQDGFDFWSNVILSCGNVAACLEVKRINTSAAYFLSIEFRETGFEVYRMYQAAYGDIPGAPVPIRFNEFLPDTREIGQGVIVNQIGWEQKLAENKQAFASEFVSRSRFTNLYGSMNDAQFVDTLNQNAAGVLSPSERDQLVTALTSGSKTRAQVLTTIAENSQFAKQEFNRAFVLMQYFGYLRRDPNTGPDIDFEGYDFWLTKLNQFNGNFEQAEMVKAFIISNEYRQRFLR
jgi:hypothetical protein